ncbi:uncharacterized protein K452DRAFT_228931 [Aplosporella prunicola CBS 121167]|uniref:PRISE-like Rossmann-fold domain-containing protein n=1 Tax=Aplosporella prunicola CBS 121167 TaxID=1176127 RepID=A0A6A6BG89_9PEZI|nr:uncharacterized protein K452DRAFT_228931 [Aplosporella prunicola CBS 121167]KAF2141531.1 hypothetical protein K452DRAFT_228931 [Aplosporella prunicola CBS 121167]
MSTHLIQTKDIYHGLPIFPEDTENLTAVVTGANGISGTHMLRVLCESPKRWEKIYALSRRPPYLELPPQVEFISMDFLKSPEEIGTQFKEKGLKCDYVFFFAYIQPKPQDDAHMWSAADELVNVNISLLRNFCEGLAIADTLPKRILLQFGTKYYGVHLGPMAVPNEESDKRIDLEPNFYYNQEDYLKTFCAKHGISWNTTRPSWIPGSAPDAAMNLCYPLAVYATVQKHLGQPLTYTSDLKAWETTTTLSSAMMNGYFSEWAVLTEDASNEGFNVCDDSAFTWGKFWPKFAGHFDMPYEGPDVNGKFSEAMTPYEPPPRGFGPAAVQRSKFTLTEWAKRPEVQKAWRELVENHGLINKEFGDVDRIFGFTDMALSMSYPILYSTTKARKLGFFGFVDSIESIFKVFDDFVGLKMIPPR